MGILLFLLRVSCVAILLLFGLLSVVLIFPLASLRVRAAMSLYWSRVLMRACGVRLRVSGEPLQMGAVLWVVNHVSWVDIFVLNSIRPTAFVAKSEIRRWPVIGWLVAGAGTVFIERGNRNAIRAVTEQMKGRFSQGEVVGLFPEGTTSSGFDVGPFHSSLFDAALRAHVDVQPVALRFFHRGQRSDYNAFVGEQNLLQNLWYLLGTTGVVVEAVFLEAMPAQACEQMGRSQVAARAHHVIRQAVVGKAA
ncbi:phospholipid/glycerol acyltransferase [Pusillimonas sp. T7-7]|uniref:lysophospholipid acyltransferase family protein n=1 Tax=Pusillimonas sp. (strain T7-7) TaxID=1007105 RepID=UPI000208439D|nr:lysophospholipid acyltransferase family protein [Pusillimonas sp. T7-7]AEC22041.1 phospholipid/glycerol acyltransferase [Pusillimonas sp. T7-7]